MIHLAVKETQSGTAWQQRMPSLAQLSPSSAWVQAAEACRKMEWCVWELAPLARVHTALTAGRVTKCFVLLFPSSLQWPAASHPAVAHAFHPACVVLPEHTLARIPDSHAPLPGSWCLKEARERLVPCAGSWAGWGRLLLWDRAWLRWGFSGEALCAPCSSSSTSEGSLPLPPALLTQKSKRVMLP